MAYLNDRQTVGCHTPGGRSRVVPDGNDLPRTDKAYQDLEKFLPHSPLGCVVGSVRKLDIRFVRVQRKHVPEKNPILDLIEGLPDYSCSSLRYSDPLSRPALQNAPTARMVLHMYVISEG